MNPMVLACSTIAVLLAVLVYVVRQNNRFRHYIKLLEINPAGRKFPCECNLCEQMIYGDEGYDGHGLGECVSLCFECDGTGSPDLTYQAITEKHRRKK